MSPCSSTAFEAPSSPGPSPGRCEGITTASEMKIKESEGYLLSTSIDELDVDEGHQPAYVFMDTEILSTLLDELVKCPLCGFHVKTTHLIGNKKDFDIHLIYHVRVFLVDGINLSLAVKK